MIQYTFAQTAEDLQGILDLQTTNHKDVVDEKTKEEQGFVTVRHSVSDITALNDIENHAITKLDGEVQAYVLAMTKASQTLIPVLEPMFELFNQITFKGKKVADYNYMVCGQVCVGEKLRGQGVFDDIYNKYREAYQDNYEFCITEIATSNTRSLKAHARVGFQIVHSFVDKFGIDWQVVIWDWRP